MIHLWVLYKSPGSGSIDNKVIGFLKPSQLVHIPKVGVEVLIPAMAQAIMDFIRSVAALAIQSGPQLRLKM